MKPIVCLALALASCAVVAGDEWDFLPERYAEAYTPSYGDWQLLWLNIDLMTAPCWKPMPLMRATAVRATVGNQHLNISVNVDDPWGYLDKDIAYSLQTVTDGYRQIATDLVARAQRYFPELTVRQLHVYIYGQHRLLPNAVWKDSRLSIE